jgi:5-methylcytosine-specific restriction endonuclease McrA
VLAIGAVLVQHKNPVQNKKDSTVTKRRAEVLTGYEIRPMPNRDGVFCYGAFFADELVAQTRHRKEGLALTLLVNLIYRLHSRQVLDQHGWRCARCGRAYLLQIHHRKFRSHGGTHRLENLEPVCRECHRLIHTHERTK